MWSTGARTPSHRRRLEFGNNRHFINVWLRNSILVDRIRKQEMVKEIWRWPAYRRGWGRTWWRARLTAL